MLSHLVSRLEVLRLSREINDQTQERLSKSQREMLLREQLKTINKELGEDDAAKSDIAELAAALDKAKLPDEVREHANERAEAPRAHARRRRRVLDAAHLPRMAGRTAVVA